MKFKTWLGDKTFLEANKRRLSDTEYAQSLERTKASLATVIQNKDGLHIKLKNGSTISGVIPNTLRVRNGIWYVDTNDGPKDFHMDPAVARKVMAKIGTPHHKIPMDSVTPPPGEEGLTTRHAPNPAASAAELPDIPELPVARFSTPAGAVSNKNKMPWWKKALAGGALAAAGVAGGTALTNFGNTTPQPVKKPALVKPTEEEPPVKKAEKEPSKKPRMTPDGHVIPPGWRRTAGGTHWMDEKGVMHMNLPSEWYRIKANVIAEWHARKFFSR